jgi:hypothetical protein
MPANSQPTYEVRALRYRIFDGRLQFQNYIIPDDHAAPDPLDFYVFDLCHADANDRNIRFARHSPDHDDRHSYAVTAQVGWSHDPASTAPSMAASIQPSAIPSGFTRVARHHGHFRGYPNEPAVTEGRGITA